MKIEHQKNTIRLEAQKNTPYSCYSFMYRVICMKIFEWKCDQLFQELLTVVPLLAEILLVEA